MQAIMTEERQTGLLVSQGTDMSADEEVESGPGLRIALPFVTFTPQRRASSRPRLSNRQGRLQSPTLVEIDNSRKGRLFLKFRSKSACRMPIYAYHSHIEEGKSRENAVGMENRPRTRERKQGNAFEIMRLLSQSRKKRSIDTGLELAAVKLSSPAIRRTPVLDKRPRSKVWSVRQSIRRQMEVGPFRPLDLESKESRKSALHWL